MQSKLRLIGMEDLLARSLHVLNGVNTWAIKHWFAIGASLIALFVFTSHYKIGFNASSSLPYHVFIIDKNNKAVEKNAYVAFRWHGGGPYEQGINFVKQVKGVPGDVVSIQGRQFFINDVYVSTAKERATTGQLLNIGPTGIIPEGRFFVFAPNVDSLDSRYQITGWIAASAVVGRAIIIF